MTYKIRGLRWWIIGTIMLASCLNFLTRSTLAVTAPTLTTQLHLTAQQYSYVLSAFTITNALQPITGYVIDVIGLKVGFALFCVAWSVITMSHGLVHSWQGLAVARGLMGLPEGAVHPAGMKATSQWFPAKERGLAGGIYNIGASLGSMLAPPLVVWATLFYNWQFAFVFTGGLGFIWLALWLWLYDSPEKHRAISSREKEYILSGQEKHLQASAARPSIYSIIRQRNFWGIALPRFLADPTWITLSFWLPLYLSTVRHMDLKQIALFAWLPFLAADIGSVFGGALVGALLKYTKMSVVNARRCAFTFGALMMLPVPLVGFVAHPLTAIALLCLGGFAHQTLSVTVITMSSDLFRKNEVATVTGCVGTISAIGQFCFTLIVGAVVGHVGYTPIFILLAVFDLIGAAVLWTFVRVKLDAIIPTAHVAETCPTLLEQ
ncbi:MFS transporter, ACS family, hexuronate transporter [Paraburkholderia fungorum]|uniref:MFS transporter, ACS family, hexuronate transporter n=2 Tax=Burkholderiaceae TaxID=119060 RepID=A0A1H1IV39_9BURK|nr:MFS transporter [Paraburkholderia fungorum]SDR41450.1 MFS transporter, ACS family, hexuronate transporter [Paraburkholderia fungorum]